MAYNEPRAGRVSPPRDKPGVVKPVRRAFARGWTFGQVQNALLAHKSRQGARRPRRARAQCKRNAVLTNLGSPSFVVNRKEEPRAAR